MSSEATITASIDDAAESVGSVWPLHSFVTANPLSGFEDRPFHEAVSRAGDLLGADGYPSPDVFRAAWADGWIEPEHLAEALADAGYDPDTDPEAMLDEMTERRSAKQVDETDGSDDSTAAVDRVLSKWLAAFLDEGTAEWPMPNREAGFYAAFRSVARHDGAIPDAARIADLPEEPVAAIREHLADHPVGTWHEVFEYQFAALPGWTGFLKHRAEAGGVWQDRYPITLAGYLAVRLTLAERFDAPVAPPESTDETAPDTDQPPLAEVWLRAWEATYRGSLVGELTEASASLADAADTVRPDAQLVFCIDTRSEVFRRHLEAAGDYETHGYAGFFGVPMRYVGYDSSVPHDACPPILDAQHRIADHPTCAPGGDEARAAHDRWHDALDAASGAVKRLKNNAATAFSFVETTGVGYGAAATARTLFPGRVRDLLDAVGNRIPHTESFVAPSVDYNPDSVNELREGLTHDEKVEYAATAFELMGWERFARLVVFTGHGSETANNPFDASLDCGACAGNPGGPNARVLAAICNDPVVRESLRERGIEVPEDTHFLAAEHNTTTDEVRLFDTGVPESHTDDLEQLRADLETARAGTTAERADALGEAPETAVEATERRAADWAETRPEWGLAGNAAFVVGPRELTADLDLDGRAFLHSYDWRTDPDGDALEAVLTGPMVVTQWINNQYYFATVDNDRYGSGSKVTQNPVGNLGVYQGNGGDLATGLPLQSVLHADGEPYHQPLRLSTVVHAPVERVNAVLESHEQLVGLLDNGWLSLTVVDPEQDHRAFDYDGDLTWEPLDAPTRAAPPTPAPAAADD